MDARKEDGGTWVRARELFLECLDLEPDERARRIEELRSVDPELTEWVERLLRQDAEAVTADSPERFGAYAIQRRIATGGMGEVYLGSRVDGEFEREVAIKLLKPRYDSEQLLRRFQRERETLANLDHEYIVRLYDGGTTAKGQPYLVLEYVDGVALDEFCLREGLDVRARLELFARVLAAVAHAHERGVVHRDLKPGNILVRADGAPRLLDFGIARITDDEHEAAAPLTRTGHRLFTPEYASPEQILGREVTTASDVFALGVVLYQLLTGRLPWAAELSQHDLERAIVASEPEPPSRRETGTARRVLAGDLDTIVQKCMAKEPARRYANASELAADLALHLGGFPIRARPTGAVTRAWRFGRRRPWTLLAGAAIVAALLTGVLAWRVQRANDVHRAELLATVRERIDTAREQREFGRLPESRLTLESALDVLTDFPEEHVLRAEVSTQLGVLANHSAKWRESLSRLAEARAELEPFRSAEPRLWASLLNAQAFALSMDGQRENAWTVAQAALDHGRTALDPGDELWLDSVVEYCDQVVRRGGARQALTVLDEAVASRRARGIAHDTGLGQLLNSLAVVQRSLGSSAEGIEPLREALAIYGWHFGEGHGQVAQLHVNLADFYFDIGRLEDAEDEYGRALSAYRTIADANMTATTLMRQGELAHARGMHALALERLRESDSVLRGIVGDAHPSTRKLARIIGGVQADSGDLAGARTSLEFALASPHGVVAYGADMEDETRLRLGAVLIALGEVETGRGEYRRVLEERSARLGAEDARTLAVRELLEQ